MNNKTIDLFTDTAAILNKFDLRSIIGCPGGMSTFRSYFRALFAAFSQNKIEMGKKILVPCLDVIMIAFLQFSIRNKVFHCIFQYTVSFIIFIWIRQKLRLQRSDVINSSNCPVQLPITKLNSPVIKIIEGKYLQCIHDGKIL